MILFLSISLFIFGLLFGSFASVLVARFRSGEGGILTGRSHCPKCQHVLEWNDLFPVFSYLFLGGKCRYCKTKIPLTYPVFELVMGLLFVAVGYFLIDANALFLGDSSEWARLGFFLLATFVGATFSFYDLLYTEIPDQLLIPFIYIGGLLTFFLPEYTPIFSHYRAIGDLPNWQNAIIGGGIIYSFFYVQFAIPFLFYFLRKRKWKNLLEVLAYYFLLVPLATYDLFAKKPFGADEEIDEDAPGGWIGLWDLRIALFMGIVWGAKIALLGLVLSYLIGTIYGIYVLSMKRVRGQEVPFGPFLFAGLMIALCFYAPIIEWIQEYLFI